LEKNECPVVTGTDLICVKPIVGRKLTAPGHHVKMFLIYYEIYISGQAQHRPRYIILTNSSVWDKFIVMKSMTLIMRGFIEPQICCNLFLLF